MVDALWFWGYSLLMARLRITTDQEWLRKVSKPVTDFGVPLHTLIDDMIETLEDVGGVGLAAVQVGVLWRVAIIEDGDEFVEVVNPVIIDQRQLADNDEMCLSLPNLCLVVTRPQRVTVRAFDRYGKEFVRRFRGLAAICACHEIDHMDGILFPDHVPSGKYQRGGK